MRITKRRTVLCPMKFLRLHLGWYSCGPTSAAKAPMESWNACPTALFVWPEMLFAGQLKTTVIAGKTPAATTIVPA